LAELRWTGNGVPLLGIAGASGSGKTTLLEALIPRLAARGLRVGVLKHAGHALALDEPGKDTDRLFAAGAAVVQAQDPGQRLTRRRTAAGADWRAALADTPCDLDLLLVEGYRRVPIAKVAVTEADDAPGVVAHVGLDVDRAEAIVSDWLAETWHQRPVGTLVLDSAVAVLAGAITGVPPVPRTAWPLSLLLAAMRWLPDHAWVIAPGTADEATAALPAARRPATWLLSQPPRLLVEPQLRARAEDLASREVPVADLTDLAAALAGQHSGA
jgi:molybdopterin-guanine dinucleotide biosynthesis protein MobB